MPFRICYYTFLMCCFSIIGYAQNQEYAYTQFTKEDGLPSNTVYGITQDKDGFMWFSTDAGLAKYDGQRFKIFTTDDGLPSNEIFELYCDSKNRIWIRTLKNELCYLHNNKVFNKFNDSLLARIKKVGQLTAVFEDSKGTIWISSMPDGIYKVIDNNAFQVKTDIMEVGGGELLEIANTICYSNWKNFYYYNQAINKFIKVQSAKYISVSGLISYANKIIQLSQDGKVSITPSDFLLKNSFLVKGRKIITVLDNVIWYPTRFGIKRYEISNHSYLKPLLPNGDVGVVFVDNKKSVWISSLTKGLYKFSMKEKNNISNYSDDQNLYSIALFDRNLICGNNSNKLQILKTTPLRFQKSIQLPKDIYSRNRVVKILKYKSSIYALSDNGKFQINIPEWAIKQTVESLRSIKNGFIINDSMHLLVSVGINKISLSTENGYLINYDKRFYSYTKYNNQDIYGSQDSLYTLKGTKLKPYTLNVSFNYRALDLCTKDSLLIATTLEKGIFIINRNKVVKNLNVSNGLSSNACYKSVLYKNTLYTASSKGINIYDFEKDSIFHVFESDGLASNTVNDLAIGNDTIYAATENGLSVIPISAIKRSRDFPFFIKPIYKTSDTIWDIPNVLVSHTDTNLTIVLNALTFSVKGAVNYYYRVKELDTLFKSTIAQDVTLNIVQLGHYTFEAYAIDGNGIFSKKIRLPIYIKPYFYQTLWFKLFLVLLGVGIILFGFQYLLARAKRKEHAKNELENKIRKLEISAWKSAINPHFLFNSLNTMQALFRINEFEKANSYVTEFSSILRKTIDQSGRLLIKLDNEIPYLKNYLELERIKRDESFEYFIDIPNHETLNYFIPSLLIQPVIENCLKHAIQDKAMGVIRISFELHADQIQCTIQDNGKGFSEVVMSKDYVSKGISLIKNKISIVERLTQKKIGFTYHNKLDASGNILGSETLFSFPFVTFDYDDSSNNN